MRGNLKLFATSVDVLNIGRPTIPFWLSARQSTITTSAKQAREQDNLIKPKRDTICFSLNFSILLANKLPLPMPNFSQITTATYDRNNGLRIISVA